MRDDRLEELKKGLSQILDEENILSGNSQTKSYREGIRVGKGIASFVVLPQNLVQFWDILNLCIFLDKIVIIQAANTGLTGGSTPDGDTYDRDVVIINTLAIDRIILLNNAKQVIALPGSTLSNLENILLDYGREPHSLIGSSCIGASIIGGICNNSGGNLVNRGPAYTELSLYASVDKNGELELINNLGIDLGETPQEILCNLENAKFDQNNLPYTHRKASDYEYKNRLRDMTSKIPARFNSDKRRLYDSSGCAGKIAVFAVRLDTFIKPKNEQVFLVGTNNPGNFSQIRKEILTSFDQLPDMAEYMHKSFFDGADKYGKDTFLIIKYFGQRFIPRLFKLKKQFDSFFDRLPFAKKNLFEKILHNHAQLLPDHLPVRIRQYRHAYSHLLIIKSSDLCIEETRDMLAKKINNTSDVKFLECSQSEGEDLLLHRYVAGIAPKRFCIINEDQTTSLLPLDVALPRNNKNWHEILPESAFLESEASFQMGHFLCMVFHWDFVFNSESDVVKIKKEILSVLDKAGAKYPAEHNVGHLYFAEHDLSNFYKKIDPTNSFNAGIGKMSKNKYYA